MAYIQGDGSGRSLFLPITCAAVFVGQFDIEMLGFDRAHRAGPILD
jgi:hypothetical protein